MVKGALFALDGLVHMRLTHVDVNDETELLFSFWEKRFQFLFISHSEYE